jgi:hypothetical protein
MRAFSKFLSFRNLAIALHPLYVAHVVPKNKKLYHRLFIVYNHLKNKEFPLLFYKIKAAVLVTIVPTQAGHVQKDT